MLLMAMKMVIAFINKLDPVGSIKGMHKVLGILLLIDFCRMVIIALETIVEITIVYKHLLTK